MPIRKTDEVTELNLRLPKSVVDKAGIRKHLLTTWLNETAGEKFLYYVETLSLNEGRHIYLKRPGNLNRGCDFVIYIEDMLLWKNGFDKPPKHSFLLDLIKAKKDTLTKTNREKFITSIQRVYECKDIDIKKFEDPEHELILKLSKWLFIEQDITYWNHSGRAMLWEKILAKCFAKKGYDEHQR